MAPYEIDQILYRIFRHSLWLVVHSGDDEFMYEVHEHLPRLLLY